jgi:hemoglobin-like flavoprotein
MSTPTHEQVTHPSSDSHPGIRRSFAAAMHDPDRFGREFYARLFALAPAIRPLFPTDLTHQRDKLVRALAMLVRGVGDPAALVPSLQQLGARHVGYGVAAPHYVVVGEALIETLDVLLPEPMDDATRGEWIKLYGWVAATMLAGAETVRASSQRDPASRALAGSDAEPSPPVA